MRFTLLAALLSIVGTFALLTAPTDPLPPTDPSEGYCGSDLLHERLLEQDSAYAEQTRRLERDYQRAMANARPKALPPPYVLPVVFHIVHNGGSENISDADVLQSLDHLNQSFANSDYYDQGTGVNTQIQFCLAERTPDNQPTTGITRTTSALTDLDADSEDLDLKNLIRYQPNEYINIWIVKEICGLGLGCGVAGYAYLPGAHGGVRDGIVVEARWLGKSEANSSVLTHEMGHYLGLRHTFNGGCLNDDCTAQGDFVCDTPPDNSTAAVPCSGSVNSCSTDTDSGFATDQDDLFNNYMDYGYWACYNAFTAGQRDRMHFFLDGRRRSLTTSPACLPPCPTPVTADFSGGDVTIPVGTTLTFTNGSTNADSYQWELDGTPFGTGVDETYTFNTVGTFRIRLTARSDDPLCFPAFAERTVTVSCPVTSDFTGTFTGLQPGESATYTSTATNATTLGWIVNGTPAGSAPTLDYTFVAPGLYTICLTADNGFCTPESCRNLLVRNASTGGCDTTNFVRRYGNEDSFGPTGVIDIAGTGAGSFIVTDDPGGLQVHQLNATGAVAQSWRLFSSTQQSLLPTDGFARPDGDLVIATTRIDATTSTGNRRAGLLRFAPATGNLLWMIELEETAISTATADAPGTGTVSWTVTRGTSNFAAEFLTVDAGTGAIVPAQSETWQTSNGRVAINDFTGLPVGQLLSGTEYMTGIGSTQRPFVARRNAGGTLDWQLRLSPLFGQPAAVATTGSTWIAALNGANPNNPNATNQSYLASGTTAGSVAWLYGYQFPDHPESVFRDVITTSDGGFLALASPEKNAVDLPSFPQLLLKVAADGSPVWARRLAASGVGPFYGRQYLAETGTGYRVLGQDAASRQPIRYDLDTEGLIAGDCDFVQLTTVEQLSIEWSAPPAELFAAPPTVISFSQQPTVTAGDLPSALLCASDCDMNADCGAPFVYLYQSDGPGEGTAVVVRPEGYYLGGQAYGQPLVVATDPDGNVSWALNLYPPGFGGTVTELRWDEAGFLFGVGRYREQQVGDTYFAFRINPANQTVLWTSPLIVPTGAIRELRVSGISADGLADQYELVGRISMPNAAANDIAVYWQLDRNTGTTVSNVTVQDSGFGSEFRDQAISFGTRYLTGSLRGGAAGDATLRPTVTAVDATGQPLWSRSYLQPATATARLAAAAIELRTGGFYLLSGGDADGTDAFAPDLWLTAHDPDGLPETGYRLTLPADVRAEQLAVWQQRVAVLAVDANDVPYVALFDLGGNFIWGRFFPFLRYANPGNGTSLHLTEAGVSLLATRDFGVATLALVRISLAGETIASCLPGEEFTAQLTPLETVYQTTVEPMSATAPIVATVGFGAEPTFIQLGDFSCPIDCPDEEICDDSIDNNGDGLTDCEDPDLALSCCCTEVPPLQLGPDTTLCASQPLMIAADTGFVSYLWQDGLTTRERTIDTPGSYSLIATDSCGRMAFDTLAVRLLPAPTLDLGPDTVVCSESVLPLDAGPGFASYRWIDGSTDPTFTAFGEGSFWVEATDSCGSVQRDTVMVSFDPATVIDLGKIQAACPGDTLRLSVPGFTEYTWYPTTGFDCRDCPEVDYVVGSDTLIWIVAKNATGCLSTDSLRLVSPPGAGSFSTVELCAGDSLQFGDTTVTGPGDYFRPTGTGCGAQDTLRVRLLATAMGSSDREICAGDSLLIGGRYRTASGMYTDTLPAANGCDSLHTTTLTVLTGSVQTTSFFLCPGDSVFVFDRFERGAGVYERIYATATGCDSTVRIAVAVSDLTLSAVATQPACGTQDEGAARATATGGTGPYTYAWSTGAEGDRIEPLAPGDYRVTVTDANGCRREATVTVAGSSIVLPVLSIRPETCPGANDGSLSVDDPQSGYGYTLADRSGDRFSGLAPGAYILRVESPDQCVDSLPVTIDAGTGLLVDLPGDTTLRLGDSLRIVPVHNAGSATTFTWSPATALDCDTCRAVWFRAGRSETVRLELRDINGCIASDELRIRVDRRELVFVPTAFSPNGDGTNDRWLPYPGPGVRRIALAQIFDRWGNLVYEAQDLDPARSDAGWDGTFSGRPMNAAVFVYRLRVELLDGRVIERYGEVMLLR